jgi:hypothetical protein
MPTSLHDCFALLRLPCNLQRGSNSLGEKRGLNSEFEIDDTRITDE